ncbi:peptidoglycan-binding domain-containing protein [Actinoplanes sp. CA-142083]|uniref:peptidoglycan-binding domain-containing protein n=1 Tax=Actinoplanes sp. CA-142083 TaxID=3239903 RepID=UPI003D8F714A
MTFGTGVLQVGSTGDGVTELQQWLIDRGFLIAAAAPTGIFDADTDQAVKAFQLSAGIGCDGQVGNGTRTAADAYAGDAVSGGWHPSAIRDVQQTSTGGSFTTTTRRGVLHTTEGTTLPSYPNPPHFTVGRDGAGATAQLWQHFPVTVAARALANPDGPPETNRYGAIQIEIIYFAQNTATMATDQPDTFQALGEWMRWAETNAGVANSCAVTFDGEKAYGENGTVRLDVAGWEASTGWVGHQHVPQNAHWDPGLIDITGLLAVSSTQSLSLSLSRPTVRATTRALSNAFPSLTLAVDPAGSPFFEIVLTTSPGLFSPSAADRRTADNFYTSRQDGLTRSADAYGRYIAPVGVVAGFARANPDGGRIFYTVVGYADEHGAGAVPAASPELLAYAAASVSMLPGFTGHTRTETLGVPLGMLAPRGAAVARAAGLRRMTPASRGLAAVPRAEADRLEGEDGYDMRQRLATTAPATPVPAVQKAGVPGFGPPPLASPPGPSPAPPPPAAYAPAPAPLSPAFTPQPSSPAPACASPPSSPAYASPPSSPAYASPPSSPSYAPPPSPNGAAGVAGSQPTAALSTVANGHRTAVAADNWYSDGWEEWDAEGGPRNLSDGDEILPPSDEFDLADPTAPPTPAPASPSPSPSPGSARPALPVLPPEAKREIVETYVGADTDLYAMVSADAEFTGAAGADHPAYQRYHLGLSFGIVAFNQDGSELGQLVTLMQRRDPARFAETFGPDAPALLDVTNRPGPLGRDLPEGRSARVQPVAGADLWTEPWLSRFRQAGAYPPFRGAQIELASGLYLDPVLRFCADLGLATPRGLAVVFDRAAHRGPTGGMAWVVETVGPLQTTALRDAALAAIGMASVEEFQRSQPDLLVDDQFGPLTHAALTGILALRQAAGVASPVPLMTYQQMIESLGRRATGQPWGDRIVRLVTDPSVGDQLAPVPVP